MWDGEQIGEEAKFTACAKTWTHERVLEVQCQKGVSYDWCVQQGRYSQEEDCKSNINYLQNTS